MATRKFDFPVANIRRYLEPGPIVLVSSAWRGENNIMTMGWHTVLEFVPSLVGCVISSGNHSFDLVRRSGECAINVPTTALTNKVVGIGNCSGASVDKFKKFRLTADPAEEVGAPLIRECHANLECKLKDDRRSIDTISSSSKWSKPTWRGGRNIRRPCTIPATACSWWPARSSAARVCSGRGCCSAHYRRGGRAK